MVCREIYGISTRWTNCLLLRSEWIFKLLTPLMKRMTVSMQIEWFCCRFDAVIHFAGRKAVGESVQFPMLYYTHNIVGAVNLIEAMRKHNCKSVSRN